MSEIVTTLDPEGAETLATISKAGKFNKWMYDQIRNYLKGDILEIGSGIGNISIHVIEDGYNITLSDYNAEYCFLLKEKFRNEPKVKDVIRIDLLQPGFEREYASMRQKFDTVFLLNVIEHVEDDNKVIQNISFLLKKGGHAIILAPAYNWLYSRFDKELGHYRRYTAASMTQVVTQTGRFDALACRYFNAAGITGWLLFGKVFHKKLIGSTEMSAFNALVPLFRLLDKIVCNKIGLSVIIIAVKK